MHSKYPNHTFLFCSSTNLVHTAKVGIYNNLHKNAPVVLLVLSVVLEMEREMTAKVCYSIPPINCQMTC